MTSASGDTYKALAERMGMSYAGNSVSRLALGGVPGPKLKAKLLRTAKIPLAAWDEPCE